MTIASPPSCRDHQSPSWSTQNLRPQTFLHTYAESKAKGNTRLRGFLLVLALLTDTLPLGLHRHPWASNLIIKLIDNFLFQLTCKINASVRVHFALSMSVSSVCAVMIMVVGEGSMVCLEIHTTILSFLSLLIINSETKD